MPVALYHYVIRDLYNVALYLPENHVTLESGRKLQNEALCLAKNCTTQHYV